MQPLAQRLTHLESAPLVLDGATGTELHRRGVDTSLPLWSARALLVAPQVLRQIHADYLAAGAELLTANTFRTHARNLRAAGLEHRAAQLTYEAVQLARQVAGDAAYVAGSQAPLEDCYAPERAPDDDTLAREHERMARHLAQAGVDLILLETHNSIREAVAAARAAANTGVPFWVSFVLGSDGRLLSGQPLREAAQAVLELGPMALLVNCCPADVVPAAMRELAAAAGHMPRGAYANIGRPDPQHGWINTDAQHPDVYARHAQAWFDAGARLIGGCCGTTPAHIAHLRHQWPRAAALR